MSLYEIVEQIIEGGSDIPGLPVDERPTALGLQDVPGSQVTVKGPENLAIPLDRPGSEEPAKSGGELDRQSPRPESRAPVDGLEEDETIGARQQSRRRQRGGQLASQGDKRIGLSLEGTPAPFPGRDLSQSGRVTGPVQDQRDPASR